MKVLRDLQLLVLPVFVRVLFPFVSFTAASDSNLLLLEEIQAFQQSASLENDSLLQSSIPHLVTLKVQHQHYPSNYSYNEWEWSSFRQLLQASLDLCRRNQTFFDNWTLPVKCEYYLMIRALRQAKDMETQLNDKEKRMVSDYVDEIYGKREDYDRIRERLKHSVIDKEQTEQRFRLKTVLESNKIDHLLSHRYFAEEGVLESCAISSYRKSNTKQLSVAFLLYIPYSAVETFVNSRTEAGVSPAGDSSQSVKLSQFSFFQTFVKSFLRYLSSDNQESQERRSYSLFIAMDERIEVDLIPSFTIRFQQLTRELLLPLIERIEVISLSERDLQSSQDSSSSEWYDYRQVIERGENHMYFFPDPFQRLLQASLSLEEIDYFYFIRETTTISDPSFFEQTIHDLQYRNHLVPHFGLGIHSLRDTSDLLVVHRSHFTRLADFPLSANVLNNSYLSPKESDWMWHHFYFTLIDIYSVFQPSLRWRNEFLSSQAINYSLIINYGTQDANQGRGLVSSQFVVNLERYKVLVERARRHLAKTLYSDERYSLYHSCINEAINQKVDSTKLKEYFSDDLLNDGLEYFHMIQFYWRPNQLLYEVNGIFSSINF